MINPQHRNRGFSSFLCPETSHSWAGWGSNPRPKDYEDFRCKRYAITLTNGGLVSVMRRILAFQTPKDDHLHPPLIKINMPPEAESCNCSSLAGCVCGSSCQAPEPPMPRHAANPRTLKRI